MLNSSKLDEPVGAGASRRPKTAGKKRRNLCGGVYHIIPQLFRLPGTTALPYPAHFLLISYLPGPRRSTLGTVTPLMGGVTVTVPAARDDISARDC